MWRNLLITLGVLFTLFYSGVTLAFMSLFGAVVATDYPYLAIPFWLLALTLLIGCAVCMGEAVLLGWGARPLHSGRVTGWFLRLMAEAGNQRQTVAGQLGFVRAIVQPVALPLVVLVMLEMQAEAQEQKRS